ncbi:hypothetical protein ACFLS7_01590 [Bacteroidota bacterium]
MNTRFEAMDKRFDQLFNFLWAIIGIFTTMMISVFGFAFWDRELSLAPLKKQDLMYSPVLSPQLAVGSSQLADNPTGGHIPRIPHPVF